MGSSLQNVTKIGQAWYISDIAKKINLKSTLNTSNHTNTIFYSFDKKRFYWCFSADRKFDNFDFKLIYKNQDLWFKDENDNLLSVLEVLNLI